MQSDFPEEVVEVWPDCWPAVHLFDSLSTQWRVGFNGPTGLDYAVLPDTARYGSELFEDIQVLEIEALKTMRGDRG